MDLRGRQSLLFLEQFGHRREGVVRDICSVLERYNRFHNDPSRKLDRSSWLLALVILLMMIVQTIIVIVCRSVQSNIDGTEIIECLVVVVVIVIVCTAAAVVIDFGRSGFFFAAAIVVVLVLDWIHVMVYQ